MHDLHNVRPFWFFLFSLPGAGGGGDEGGREDQPDPVPPAPPVVTTSSSPASATEAPVDVDVVVPPDDPLPPGDDGVSGNDEMSFYPCLCARKAKFRGRWKPRHNSRRTRAVTWKDYNFIFPLDVVRVSECEQPRPFSTALFEIYYRKMTARLFVCNTRRNEDRWFLSFFLAFKTHQLYGRWASRR